MRNFYIEKRKSVDREGEQEIHKQKDKNKKINKRKSETNIGTVYKYQVINKLKRR